MIGLYFGTNRNPNRARKPTDFGIELNGRGTLLRFGEAWVKDDLSVVEKIDTKTESLNPSRGLQRLGSEAIFTEIRQKMAAGTDTILFIHGFNYSFKEALIDAARLKKTYDTDDRSYSLFLFTWPSDGSLMPFIAYPNDKSDAEASGSALGRGLLKLGAFVSRVSDELGPATRSDLKRESARAKRREQLCRGRLHLLAHSMGAFALRCAVQGMRKQIGDVLPRLFDEVLLLAADEDDDAFEHSDKLALLPSLARRVTVYHNREDIPLVISDWTKGNPDRIGSEGPRRPYDLPGKVSVVDCTDVVGGFQEHRYHVNNEFVVADIRAVLNGERSERIIHRHYVPETKSYRLDA